MNFKEEKLRAEFFQISPYLRRILTDAECFLHAHDLDLFLTELIRPDAEQAALYQEGQEHPEAFPDGILPGKTSVHQFGRGGDARPTSDEVINKGLIEYINSKYLYDPQRPELLTLIRHHGTADHWHFQTLA